MVYLEKIHIDFIGKKREEKVMACFVAPMTEAVVVSVVKRRVKKKDALQENGMGEAYKAQPVTFSRKLGWLSNLLWGGSYLLAIEHIWHGEVVPYPPFLTAFKDSADILPMLQEVATVGVSMAVVITAVWGGMVAISNYKEKHKTIREARVK